MPKSNWASDSNEMLLQDSDPLHARPVEDLLLVVHRVHLAAQVLAGPVQVFVHFRSPFRAIADIINESIIGDVFSRPALTVRPAQGGSADPRQGCLGAGLRRLRFASRSR